jgi:hypothetical protein
MIGSITRVWTQNHNLEVIPEAATHFYKNFSQIEEEDLVAAIRLNAFDRVLTRERDAKSVAETMRRLGGAHVPIGNVASCRFIFTTTNTALQRRVSAFLSSKRFVLDGEFNPVVTSRYLSGLCWILCGGRADQSPTTARLLANCAAALRLKPEIADRTKRFLSEIDPEKAKHFEALMTNERASQYLAEVTQGDMNAVTANNVEDIFEEIQRRAAEKVSIEKDQHYLGQIAVLQNSSLVAKQEAEKLRESLQENQLEIFSGKVEIRALSQLASNLQIKHDESEAKFTDQSNLLQTLTSQAAEASRNSMEAQRLLIDQLERSRTTAMSFAERRTKKIRLIGGIAMFLLVFLIEYLEKFIIPALPVTQQPIANLILIIFQALLAIAGLGLFVDRFVHKPIEWLRKRFYRQRLAELGIPETTD